MTGTEAIEFIQSISWRGSKPGLERTQALLAAMGNPERRLKYIHIAGTNGKGSTAAMLSSVLQRAGYRVGLFTSPYLQRFHERMQVNGRPIPDEELGSTTARVVPLAKALTDRPTEFEMMTCVAFQWFADRRCDIVVLETGMGGRLDATNVIEHPEVCVITAIGLDHTRELGGTTALIAGEKAGILKPGAPVVLYEAPADVDEVIAAACARKGCPLTRTRPGTIRVHADSMEGQDFDYPPYGHLKLSLLGGHQRKNAAVAVETLLQLRTLGWDISDEAIREGLAAARWPGRFEILRREPLFIADGGHNPQCAEALAANLANYFPDKPIHLLLGVMADKDWHTVMDTVAPLAASFTTVTPDNPRSLDSRQLGRYLKKFGKPVTVCGDAAGGIASLLARVPADEVICSFGSLYLTGQVRTLLLG